MLAVVAAIAAAGGYGMRYHRRKQDAHEAASEISEADVPGPEGGAELVRGDDEPELKPREAPEAPEALAPEASEHVADGDASVPVGPDTALDAPVEEPEYPDERRDEDNGLMTPYSRLSEVDGISISSQLSDLEDGLPKDEQEQSNIENFRRWITARLGSKDRTAFWYSVGELYSYPDGKLLAVVEGVDATRAIVYDASTAYQLTRKLFLYRDPETHEVLTRFQGHPVKPMKHPYQLLVYSLQGDSIVAEITQGVGQNVRKLGGNKITVRRLPGTSKVIFTAPVFININTPKGPFCAYENFDFFLNDGEQGEGSYCSWVRYGSTPPFTNHGVMHMVCWRVESFDAIPSSLRTYITQEAPLWMAAPEDLTEVQKLQADVELSKPTA
eukprot:jgi/Mesvir1/5054/Mv02255-RA.1